MAGRPSIPMSGRTIPASEGGEHGLIAEYRYTFDTYAREELIPRVV
jgi:hypothetical protein